MQQQNFKKTLQAMSAVKGWELLEHDSLLALKTPSV
jgi:hypothetical protein